MQDAFTSYFETPLVLDLIDLIRALGFRPWLAPYRPNGKPLHVHGFLKAFERVASANAAMLRDLADTGVDLIGLDPSMTLTYRAEYAGALNGIPLPRVLLVQEWLGEHLDAITAVRDDRATCCCPTAPSARQRPRRFATGRRFRPPRAEAHGPAVRLLRHGGHLRARGRAPRDVGADLFAKLGRHVARPQIPAGCSPPAIRAAPRWRSSTASRCAIPFKRC